MTHDLLMSQNRTMQGASAGLVRLDDGRVVAVTARHLLGPMGGFDPPIKLADVDNNVAMWMLHPRTLPHSNVRLGKLATKLEEEETKNDCLVVNVAPGQTHFPCAVLTMRNEPLKIGDTVYLLGVPYSEPNSKQNVYAGKVKTLYGNGEVEYVLPEPIETRGFSGAPVIDENGHFAGVNVGHLNESGSNGKYTNLMMVSATIVRGTIRPK
jgi:hypothetical protein